jgi:DNA-binding MarR family transcriptional regulator
MLGLAVARLTRLLELVLTGDDLSVAQYRMLGLIVHGETASSRLAEYLAVSPSGITLAVDGLVERGLVVRELDPDDRRRTPLRATRAGKRAWEQADSAVTEALDDVTAKIDAPELLDALERWNDAFRDYIYARRDD